MYRYRRTNHYIAYFWELVCLPHVDTFQNKKLRTFVYYKMPASRGRKGCALCRGVQYFLYNIMEILGH